LAFAVVMKPTLLREGVISSSGSFYLYVKLPSSYELRTESACTAKERYEN